MGSQDSLVLLEQTSGITTKTSFDIMRRGLMLVALICGNAAYAMPGDMGSGLDIMSGDIDSGSGDISDDMGSGSVNMGFGDFGGDRFFWGNDDDDDEEEEDDEEQGGFLGGLFGAASDAAGAALDVGEAGAGAV